MLEFSYEVHVMIDRKKKKLGGVAMVGIASALLAAACKSSQDAPFNPSNNKNADVYGPPIETTGDYDPAYNMNNDVYGPPEDMEKKPSGGITFEQVTPEGINPRDLSGNLEEDLSDDGFKPADNIAEPVYGPPAGEKDATE